MGPGGDGYQVGMGLGGEDMSPEWKRVQVGKGPWRDGWGRYLGGEDPSGVVMDLGGSLGLCNGGGVGEREGCQTYLWVAPSSHSLEK